MTIKDPTPDELIVQLGLQEAADIDQRLMETCDEEMNAEPPRPQDIRLAFNCLRAILMRHWENPDPKVQKHVAGALMRRAQILSHTGRIDEARWDFEEVWQRYRDSDDPAVRKAVAAGLLEAGNHEERQENYTAAEKWYELTGKYADDADPMTQYQVVQAQCNICDTYIDRDWIDPAVEKVDDLYRRWGEHSNYSVRRRIANLLSNIAFGMMQNDEWLEDAPAACDAAIDYANKAVIPPAFFIQVGSWISKCRSLKKLERYEDVVLSAQAMENWIIQVVRKHPDYEQPVNKQAEHGLKRVYEISSQCLSELGRHKEALEILDRCGFSIDDLVEDMRERETAFNNLIMKVKVLADLGRHEEADSMYSAILGRTMNFKPAWTEEMAMTMAFSLDYIKRAKGEA